MTRNIGASQTDPQGIVAGSDIKKVLVIRPNHRLGNLLLITPLLQEVQETFPDAVVDLFVKGNAAPLIFKNYPSINRIIRLPAKPFKNLFAYLAGWIRLRSTPYDLVINTVYHSSSGRLSTRFAQARYKCFGDLNEDIRLNHPDCEHVAKHPVYSFRYFLEKSGFPVSKEKIPSLNISLSPEEIAEGNALLHNIVKNQKGTICIFTFATGEKCYPPSWWEPFYERLKNEFPEYNIVEMLPVENVSQISFKAPSFYSKNVRQIGSFIANTDVFIGADSGMMHLASAALTPTVGLFKVTNPRTFGPYNNRSIAIDTNNSTSMEEWISLIRDILSKK